MTDILKINNVIFPLPASYEINLEDKTNEFEAENGQRTIEIIREGIVSIAVSYNSLTAQRLSALKSALTKVSTVKYYDPNTNAAIEKQMEVSGIRTGKQYYRNNISCWSLSFNLKEL